MPPLGNRKPTPTRFREYSDTGVRPTEYQGQEARKAAAREAKPLSQVKRERRLKLLRKFFR